MNRKIKCALALALAVTCAIVASAEPKYDTPQTKEFIQKIGADLKAGKLIEVSAGKLISEYQSNEVVADSKFKDKFLFVSGTVESVSKNASGTIVLSIRSGRQYGTAMARFDAKVLVISGMEGAGPAVVTMKGYPVMEAVTMVKRGSRVHVICRGDGFFLGIPQLRNCDAISR